MLRQIRSGLAKKRDDKIHIRACERETHKYKTYILTSIDRFKMAKKKSVSSKKNECLHRKSNPGLCRSVDFCRSASLCRLERNIVIFDYGSFGLPFECQFVWQGNVLPLNHGDKLSQNSILRYTKVNTKTPNKLGC